MEGIPVTKKKELPYRHPDCQHCKDEVKRIRERAREVADELMGSCNSLHSVLGDADEHLQDDYDFLDTLDGLVAQCNGCGWWGEPCMVNDDCDTCDECFEEEPEEDDEDEEAS